MIGFRVGGLWMLGLVWLAVGVGCADTADRNAKPEEVASIVEPEVKAESDSVEKPVEKSLADEPGAIVIPLDQIWALDMPGARDIEELDGSLVEEAQHAIGHATPGNQERPCRTIS